MNPRWRPVIAVLPAVALIAGGWGFYAIWHKYASELHGASAGLHSSWLIGASVLWLATYMQLILLWAASFPWWGSRD